MYSPCACTAWEPSPPNGEKNWPRPEGNVAASAATQVGPTFNPSSENFLLPVPSLRSSRRWPGLLGDGRGSSLVSGWMPLTLSWSPFSWFRRSATSPFRRSFSPFRSRSAARISSSLSRRFRMLLQHSSCFFRRSGQNGHDVGMPPVRHDFSLAVCHGQHHAAVHKAAFLVLLSTSGAFLPSPDVVI